MYEDFFEMKKTPFVRSIPVDDLYMDQDTEEIHNRLLYATRRQLFALVIGDPGTGKTTSLRRLKSALNGQEYAVLYLSESKLSPRYFYNGLLEQCGCETRFYRGDARNLPPLPERADIDQLAAAAHKHGRAMPGQAAEQILGIDRFTRNRAA